MRLTMDLKRKGMGFSILFTLFLTANMGLSYAPLSFEAKLWVFLLLVCVPLAMGLWQARLPPRGGAPCFEETAPPATAGWFYFLLAAAIALRFYKLFSIPPWMSGDEALQGLFGIELVKAWNWKFFYTVGQHPPLPIWLFSFFIRIFPSSLFVLRVLPAAFSLLALLAGYWAARNYFSKSFSIIIVCLLGFCFWPIYCGRFYLQLIPFWELTALGLLARCLREESPGRQKIMGGLLGFWTGLGSLTYTSSYFVMAAVLLTLLFHGWKKPERNPSIRYFLFFCGIALVPFLGAVFREGFGTHILEIIGSGNVALPARRWIVFLSYFTSIFWGSLDKGASYGPVWGGFLNPILSAFFFLGIIEMFRWRRAPLAQWMTLCLLIFMLPGFFAADYTVMFRVVQAMVIVLLAVGFGIQKMLLEVGYSFRWILLIPFLFASTLADFYHLLKPHLTEKGPKVFSFKTDVPDENFRAFQLLDDFRKKSGPGLIFTDFLLLSHNHSLYVATYPFNASCNPKLDPGAAKWAALLVNINYAPFLAGRLEGLEIHSLGSDLFNDGGLMLGLIPLTPKNKIETGGWIQAQANFHQWNLGAEDILQNPEKYKKTVEGLPDHYPFAQKDPLIISCFYEWMAQYHYALNDYAKNRELVERAIEEGYPAAHLYFKLGNLWWLDHQASQAEKAYESAIGCRGNRTMAAEALASLQK